ncbi:DUF1993 domain-containing protein [Gallaecimonas kandeliae]|uniref:DUF1993 domain-containing protein n=1 Tax=Gallaecimonas kandeliae TaxID=3029055 RepID=UPI00264A32C2|nr:DUF1993 domain-containing protein [Gallaecimonas kandeliae]WKE66570.1 DUF1993 domain-containing protein [Gallaecimonas kandeliae]
MPNPSITQIKDLFISRLDVLEHILAVAEAHFPNADALLSERLAPDMFPLAGQIAIACNQPRGFSQWCAGQPIDNLSIEIGSLAEALGHIRDTKARVAAIDVADAKLDEIKRIGLGPGRHCELPGRQYLNDYLVPNLYFHISMAYAILRHLGAPLGKTDFMGYLAPYIREEN